MNWSELLTQEIESTYAVTKGLFELTDDEMLQWKPATGCNWMTTGQLLKHITIACGGSMRGFVTGDWSLPEGVDVHSLSTEEMLAPAETMQAVGSVAEAKKLLEEDERLALSLVSECSEKDLDTKQTTAPWDQTELILGHRLLQMVDHLKVHKAQLFYYLKLQNKAVHTGNLWGM
ncbi:DinB family protein [Prosthecochloris sp. SCSIO W1101]|uniref:DinB family protein n=1 Tax=Prosthecochloris sp. SCSIO W1101 TaxID=2992242 RepID=UPI00223CBBE3|nr:DinB family protein [Prosthecochloris sp. SCSIO W1101]UZJ41623.1 DinB family protein [Prosthecochloris sp. SCSIO W1101]